MCREDAMGVRLTARLRFRALGIRGSVPALILRFPLKGSFKHVPLKGSFKRVPYKGSFKHSMATGRKHFRSIFSCLGFRV